MSRYEATTWGSNSTWTLASRATDSRPVDAGRDLLAFAGGGGWRTAAAVSPEVTDGVGSPGARPLDRLPRQTLDKSGPSALAIDPEVSMTNVSAASGRVRSDES